MKFDCYLCRYFCGNSGNCTPGIYTDISSYFVIGDITDDIEDADVGLTLVSSALYRLSVV